MEKKVTKKTKLNNGRCCTVTIRRNIQIWISTTNSENKRVYGSSISILDPNNPFDKEGIKRGAFARVGLANGFYLSKNNYNIIKKCYEEALKCEFNERRL